MDRLQSTRLLVGAIEVTATHPYAADGDLAGTPTGWRRPRGSVMYTRTFGKGLPTVMVSPGDSLAMLVPAVASVGP